MDEREREVLHWVWADTLDDHGQLWSMAKRAREEYGLTDWREVKREMQPTIVEGRNPEGLTALLFSYSALRFAGWTATRS